MINRVEQEKLYWDGATTMPNFEKLFISDINTETCLIAIRPHMKYGTTLDLGCGVGRLIKPLAEDSDACFYGVDTSPYMLKIAHKRCKKNKNVIFLCNDGRTIPVNEPIFDFVYSMLLFQHLPQDAVQGYIAEVARVLKHNGQFHFQFIEGTEDEPYSHHYGNIQMQEYLEDVGLMVIRNEKGEGHPLWTWLTAAKR
jgi:ubiquinone/menaquinone biosynthesis C-methylase UbiE